MIFDVPVINIVLSILIGTIYVFMAAIAIYFRKYSKGNPILFTILYTVFLLCYAGFAILQSNLCLQGHGNAHQKELHSDVFTSIFVSEMLISILVGFTMLAKKWPKEKDLS